METISNSIKRLSKKMSKFKCDPNEYLKQFKDKKENLILTFADILPHIDKTSIFPI